MTTRIGPGGAPFAQPPATGRLDAPPTTTAPEPAKAGPEPSGDGGAAPLFADSFERATAAPAQAPAAFAGGVGPNSGTAIQAKAKTLPGHGGVRVGFEFDRPLTQEQAAQVLFQGGKVPDGAKLVPGQDGKTWILETPDMDTHQATLRKMNSRTETVDYGKPGEVTMSWTGGPNVVSKGPPRRDLQNDYGFVIAKHYPLDQGQIPDRHVKSMVGKGHGYEVAFDKPMTQKEVMEKLFEQGRFEKGDVKAVPVGTPPAMVWQIQIVGPDALTSIKHPYSRAFSDASVYAKESMNPGVPSGMKSHFENKTVPKDAKHFPPGTYVWEQEGHIAYVTTDGKGNYHHEFTKLHPTEEKFNNTIRHFMLEKGMPPREGWKAFSEHWDDIHRQILMAFMGALSGARMPGKAPSVRVPTTPRRTPAVTQQPKVNVNTPQVRTGKTLPGHPPAAPKPAGGAGSTGAPKTQPDVGKTMTADPGRARTQSPATQPDHGKTMTADPARARTQPGAANQAGGGNAGGQQTVDTTSPSSPPAGGAGRQHKPGDVLVGRPVDPVKRLPADMKITVKTPGGPKNMTVGEYRQRHAEAKKWMSERMQEYQSSPGARKGALPPNYEQLSQEAQRKFGLDPGWESIGNKYIHGPL